LNKIELRPHHLGISVADLDESIRWYEEMLGFSLTDRVYVEHLRCQIATLKNGSFDLELFCHDDSLSLPAERLHPDTDIITQGTKHFCFTVSGLDEFVAELQSKGVNVIVGPGVFGSSRFYYICDNSGILLELNEPIKD